MITIILQINGDEIDRIDIGNQGVKNKRGQTLYYVVRRFIDKAFVPYSTLLKIWHRREEGALKLSYKVLKKLDNDS